MAITITTSLDANVAAFAPVTIAGTTTRNPFTDGVRQGGTIGTLDNNGGYLRIATSTTVWLVDDTVIISDATGDYAQYNGRHKVTSITSSNVLTTSTTWVTATTGDEGNVYRLNDNLYIKAVVKNGSAEIVETLYTRVNTLTAVWSFDISKPLQSELGSIFSLTSGEVSTALASHSYTITLYEIFQGADLAVVESVHGTVPSTIAHRTTELKTEFTSGSRLLTGDFSHDGKILIHFLMNTGGATVGLRFTEADGTVTNTGALTETRWHYAYVFESTSDFVKVVAYDIVESTILTAPIYIKKIGCASSIIYYVNRWGGYEAREIHYYDSTQKSTKVDKYTGEAWEERIMQLLPYQNSENESIRDIVTSPEVYDENLSMLEVTTNSVNYRSQEVEPEIRVKIKETFLQ